MTQLTIQGLKKHYDTEVLSNINLAVEKGEMISIMGPSGSGKTTLLRILSMLETPSKGTIKLDGKKQNHPEHRRKIGIVFQKPVALNTSVYENVAYGLRLRKEPKHLIKEKVNKMLKKVNIPEELHNKNALCLSGGEIQRVALARSLVTEPELLLLDEPTANLDKDNTEKFEQLLKTINNQTTIIFTTHDKAQAQRLGNKVYHIHNKTLKVTP